MIEHTLGRLYFSVEFFAYENLFIFVVADRQQWQVRCVKIGNVLRFDKLNFLLFSVDNLIKYSFFYLVLIIFEMPNKFNIYETINHILLPDGNESDIDDGSEEEEKLLQAIENDLDPDYDSDQDINTGTLGVKVEDGIAIIEDEDAVGQSNSQQQTYSHLTNNNQQQKNTDRRKSHTLFQM